MAAAKHTAMRLEASAKFRLGIRRLTAERIYYRGVGEHSHYDALRTSTAPSARMDEMFVRNRKKFHGVEHTTISSQLQAK